MRLHNSHLMRHENITLFIQRVMTSIFPGPRTPLKQGENKKLNDSGRASLIENVQYREESVTQELRQLFELPTLLRRLHIA